MASLERQVASVLGVSALWLSGHRDQHTRLWSAHRYCLLGCVLNDSFCCPNVLDSCLEPQTTMPEKIAKLSLSTPTCDCIGQYSSTLRLVHSHSPFVAEDGRNTWCVQHTTLDELLEPQAPSAAVRFFDTVLTASLNHDSS